MNRKLLISVLAVFILAVGSINIVRAYTVLNTAAAINAEGQIPLNTQALLDNFNARVATNAWNCLTGTFSKTTVTPTPANEKCTTSYSADTPDGTGYSLRLDYNVSQTSSYDGKPTFAGYYSQLGGGSLVVSPAYTAISFRVKGAVGGEFFKIELKNKGTAKYWDAAEGTNYYRNTASACVNDFHENGAVSQEWKKVTIPLHNFTNLDGFSSMKELVFVFDNSQSVTNGSSTSGTIYIDNIMFETAPVPIVKIDPFGDKLPVNSLGGNMGVSGGGTTYGNGTGALSFATATSDAYHTCLNALKYDFNVSAIDSYVGAFFIFGGGYTDNTVEKPDKGGWIKVPHDFSAYNNITFWARAQSDAKNPWGFKVELHDFSGSGTGEPFYVIRCNETNPLMVGWKKYTIPLNSFEDWDHVVLHKDHIAELVFTIEYGNVPGGQEIGTMYIDDVQFE